MCSMHHFYPFVIDGWTKFLQYTLFMHNNVVNRLFLLSIWKYWPSILKHWELMPYSFSECWHQSKVFRRTISRCLLRKQFLTVEWGSRGGGDYKSSDSHFLLCWQWTEINSLSFHITKCRNEFSLAFRPWSRVHFTLSCNTCV